MVTKVFLAPAQASVMLDVDAGFVLPPFGTAHFGFIPNATTVRGNLLPVAWNQETTHTYASTASVSTQDVCMGMWVSAPTDVDQVITSGTSATVAFVGVDMENNLNANFGATTYWEASMYWPGGFRDGNYEASQKRGVISRGNTSFGSMLEATAIDSKQITRWDTHTAASYTQPSFQSYAGDIMVVEISVRFTQAAAVSYNVSFVFGGSTDVSGSAENAVVATPGCYFSLDNQTITFTDTLSSVKAVHQGVCTMSANLTTEITTGSIVATATITATLTDGLNWTAVMVGESAIAAVLNTQLVLTSALVAESTIYSSFPQTHELTSAINCVASMDGFFSPKRPQPGLVLFYSGIDVYSPPLSLGGAQSLVPYRDQTMVFALAIPGLTLLTASGFQLQDGTLSYNPSGQVLTLDTGEFVFTTGLASKPYVVIGNNDRGYMEFVVDYPSLPVGLTSTAFTPVNVKNTLFDDSVLGDAAGRTDYRCLYIVNLTAEEVVTVGVRVSGVSSETITLGTDFVVAAGLPSTSVSDSIKVGGSAVNAPGRAAVFSLVRGSTSGLGAGASPYLFIDPDTVQESDGITVDLPRKLVDSNDSTGVLAGVSFGSTLDITRIQALTAATFWVKKVQPASPTPVSQDLKLSLNATI